MIVQAVKATATVSDDRRQRPTWRTQSQLRPFRRILANYLGVHCMNSTPDGSLTDKPMFLARIDRGSAMWQITKRDGMVGLPDDAITHATKSDIKSDGSTGDRHDTDDWQPRSHVAMRVRAYHTTLNAWPRTNAARSFSTPSAAGIGRRDGRARPAQSRCDVCTVLCCRRT